MIAIWRSWCEFTSESSAAIGVPIGVYRRFQRSLPNAATDEEIRAAVRGDRFVDQHQGEDGGAGGVLRQRGCEGRGVGGVVPHRASAAPGGADAAHGDVGLRDGAAAAV